MVSNYNLLYGSLLIPNFMLVIMGKEFAINLNILIRTGVVKKTVYMKNSK